jgi:hypothetical protein
LPRGPPDIVVIHSEVSGKTPNEKLGIAESGALPVQSARSKIADFAVLQAEPTSIQGEEASNHIVSDEQKGRSLT